MLFPRRKCCSFVKKSLGAIILACFCVTLLNLLCFDGNCSKQSENETIALSSLSEVILEANVDYRNGQSPQMASLNTPGNSSNFKSHCNFQYLPAGVVMTPPPPSLQVYHLVYSQYIILIILKYI